MTPDGRRGALGIGGVTLAVVGAVVAVGWGRVPSATVAATAVGFVVAAVVVAVGLASRRVREPSRGREDAPEFAVDDRASVEPATVGPVERTDWSFRESDGAADGNTDDSAADPGSVDDAGDDDGDTAFEFGPELESN